MPKIIVDIVLIAIILFCGWCGYKKGLIMGIGGVVVIIVSVLCANLLANTFSYEIVPVMRPFVSGYIETTLTNEEDGVLTELGYDDEGYSLADVLEQEPELAKEIGLEAYRRFGLSADVAEQLSDEAIEHKKDSDRDLLYSLSEVFCQRVSRVACLILAFLLILIVLTVIGNITNLSFKLPNMDLLDDVGGACLGVVRGIMFCLLITWALRYLGLVFGLGYLEETWLASGLMKANLFAKILGV